MLDGTPKPKDSGMQEGGLRFVGASDIRKHAADFPGFVPGAGAKVVGGLDTSSAPCLDVWPGWRVDGDGTMEESMMHAANVTAAAHYADQAAKHAASTAHHTAQLAQWVSHLWAQHESLTAKVKELEDWKKRTLEDMRKLRDEHKQLRKKFPGGEEPKEETGVKKAVSMPVSSSQDGSSPDGTTMSGPPGLDLPRGASTPTTGEDNDSSPTKGADPGSFSFSPKEDGDGKNEGVNVTDMTVNGNNCQRAGASATYPLSCAVVWVEP